MKVAILRAPRDLRIEAEPDLSTDIGPSRILVRTIVSGLSAGTELAVYTGRWGPDFYGWIGPCPTELGYLSVGRVVAVGADVAKARPGDVIYTLTRHRQEHMISEKDLFWHVPDGLPPEIAVFAYLINLGLHALRRGGLIPGERVAIVGLGPIGLAAVAIARTLGAPAVAVDPEPARRALALRLGAVSALDPRDEGFHAALAVQAGEEGIDLAVETAGTWSAIRTCCEIVRQEGRVSIVALHPGDAEENPLGELFYRKQLSLISTSLTPREDYPPERVRFTLRRNVRDILDGLATGRIDYGAAVTHRIHYTELPEMFERMAEGDRSMGAVAVQWDSP